MQRNFDAPDESTATEMSRFEVIRVGGLEFTRATYQPGWTWQKYSQPTAGGDSCLEHHLWFVVSGRMGIRMDDGTEAEWGAGDVGEVLPGHIAWVIGDAPFVAILVANHAASVTVPSA